MLRKPITWIVAGTFAMAVAFGLYWFAPWKLLTNSTVDEPLPSVAATPSGTGPSATGSPAPSGAPAGNTLLATGDLITHEHDTRGQVRLIRLADGRVQLTLAGLATSDGPDLHVWLTDQPVVAGRDGWHVFDDGRYVDLGALKANNGNQVYDVPAGTDLKGLTSVTIWCKRFAVSFGAAQLT